MKSKLLLFCLMVMSLAGCQTAILQGNAADTAAKRFATEIGKAKIYIYRLSRLAGAARIEPVFIDGRMLGQNGSGTFLVADVDAGHHTVATTASMITIDADAGTAYFVKQEHSAWGPTSSVERVTEGEGKKGIRACKLAVALY
jgi:hypothetical protein